MKNTYCLSDSGRSADIPVRSNSPTPAVSGFGAGGRFAHCCRQECPRSVTILLALQACSLLCGAQTASLSLAPSADAFVRAQAPTNNYGGAGALAVSGALAVNGNGQTNGIFNSLLRFPLTNFVAWMDASLGTTNWLVTRATLHTVEVAAPGNPLFNRGVSAFEIRWIASDAWTEGTGTPNAPTTDGVAFQDLPSILNPAADATLGQFTNHGADGPISFDLGLAPPFLADIRSGAALSLHLSPLSDNIGFTMQSRSYVTASDRPSLEIVAAANPNPSIESLAIAGTNATIIFNTRSNWTYRLQFLTALPLAGSASWSNVVAVPPQSTDGQTVIIDQVTGSQRWYRLSVSP